MSEADRDTIPIDPRPLLDLARRLAVDAGRVLLAHAVDGVAARVGLGTESKGVRRELVTRADRAAEEVVVGGILAARPDDAILAEEGALTPRGRSSRDAAAITWIVDPLDGTTNFVHGLPFFAVAIAAYAERRPLVGVVHAPRLATTWFAAAGHGAHRETPSRAAAPIAVGDTADLRDALLATGFSYVRDQPGRDDNLGRIAAVLPRCRDLRRYGSAELDLCMTADGSFDGYWEMDLAPYDVAAGALIVREAGGRITDLRGGDDWLFGGSILASNGRLHRALLDLVGDPER